MPQVYLPVLPATSFLGVPLGTLVNRALRVAGIQDRPGRGASPEQAAEVIAIANAMFGSWNVNELDIYTTSIDRYALTPIQTTYFIGPTGDFVAPRPVRIVAANAVVPGGPQEIHWPMKILDNKQWAAKRIPELPGASWPRQLYNDAASPDSKLYLYPLFSVLCDLELFTWQALRRDFGAMTDDVVLPDGYERAIVYNLAVEVAAHFTTQSKLDPRAEGIANKALAAIESNNAPVPTMKNDAKNIGKGPRGESRWWLTGGM